MWFHVYEGDRVYVATFNNTEEVVLNHIVGNIKAVLVSMRVCARARAKESGDAAERKLRLLFNDV